MNESRKSPRWMTAVLYLAAAYNLAWSGWMGLFPADSLRVAWGVSTDDPITLRLWQGVGGLVGVFGVGYALAARDPVEHWLVVLVGLLSKVLAVLGAIQALGTGSDNGRLLLLALPNDALWLVPFALIVVHARRAGRDPAPS